MRRALAISLIAIFCLPVGMLLAKGFEEDPLPACCRRGGAHHCAMMAMLMGTEGTSFRGANPCPMLHAGQLGSTVAVTLPVEPPTMGQLCDEELIRVSSFRPLVSSSLPNRQRGPPLRG